MDKLIDASLRIVLAGVLMFIALLFALCAVIATSIVVFYVFEPLWGPAAAAAATAFYFLMLAVILLTIARLVVKRGKQVRHTGPKDSQAQTLVEAGDRAWLLAKRYPLNAVVITFILGLILGLSPKLRANLLNLLK